MLRQAKSCNIEAQLANTAAKVKALQQEKQQLEASNVLLRQSSNLVLQDQVVDTCQSPFPVPRRKS